MYKGYLLHWFRITYTNKIGKRRLLKQDVKVKLFTRSQFVKLSNIAVKNYCVAPNFVSSAVLEAAVKKIS